jgi:methylenetetrahydrofolate reductase (NADPH)
MAKIADLLAAGRTTSFEFFPPKTDAGVVALDATVDELASTHPSFVSVTYGAGGSTRDRTRSIVLGIDARHEFPAMPHLTCAGHSKVAVLELLDDYRNAGIENILALAGDPPLDGGGETGDFRFALELVDLVRSHTNMSIGVAAFPELHPRSSSRDLDRRHLAAKLRAADFAITQFFYDADDYRRLQDDLAALGIDKPVLPGIMAPTNPTGVRRMATMNGSAVPDSLLARIDDAGPEAGFRIAVDATAELCRALLDAGAPGLHFYTLNRADVVVRVLAELT